MKREQPLPVSVREVSGDEVIAGTDRRRDSRLRLPEQDNGARPDAPRATAPDAVDGVSRPRSSGREYLYRCRQCLFEKWFSDHDGPKSHIVTVPEDEGEVLARQEEHVMLYSYPQIERGTER